MLILFPQIAVILITCRLFGYFGRRAGQAQAVCDMIAGLALGPSLLGVLAPGVQGWLFPQQVTVLAGDVATTAAHPSMTVLYALSQLGLALYMFIVGLDFDMALFRSRVRSVGVVPGGWHRRPAAGCDAALFLHEQPGFFHATIGRWHAALFLGASMSVTAFPMLARFSTRRAFCPPARDVDACRRLDGRRGGLVPAGSRAGEPQLRAFTVGPGDAGGAVYLP